MADLGHPLECRLGDLSLNGGINRAHPDHRHYTNPSDYSSFVVEATNGSLTLYLDNKATEPPGVVSSFGLSEEDIVAGGYVYLKKRTLVLDGGSTEYGALPLPVARQFASLLAQKLKKEGASKSRALANSGFAFYWRNNSPISLL